MVYKRVSSALFFSIVWMLLVCPKAYSQSNSMRVARIFSDNMVLQQGIYAPVWGWADSGATVRISMSEKEYETVADDTGNGNNGMALDPISWVEVALPEK